MLSNVDITAICTQKTNDLSGKTELVQTSVLRKALAFLSRDNVNISHFLLAQVQLRPRLKRVTLNMTLIFLKK